MLGNVFFFLNNAQESFRDSLKEVYKLNKCPSLQDSIKYAMEHDCSVMETAVGSSSQIIFKSKIHDMHAYLFCIFPSSFQFLRCTVGAGITNEVSTVICM